MAKIGRNEPCPCGSGKKYKKCCLAKDEANARAVVVLPPAVTIVEDRVADEPEWPGLVGYPPIEWPDIPESVRAIDERWDQFEVADVAGQVEIFRELLGVPGLDPIDATEMLDYIREASTTVEQRQEWNHLITELKERAPEIYYDQAGYINDWLIDDALVEGDIDRIPELLQPFVEDPEKYFAEFFRAVHALMYHGHPGAALAATLQAWPAIADSVRIHSFGIQLFADLAATLTCFAYLDDVAKPRPDDPLLLQALELLGGIDIATVEQDVSALLSEPPGMIEFERPSSKQELQKSTRRLSFAWLGYLHRHDGVPLAKGQLARTALTQYINGRIDKKLRGTRLFLPEPRFFDRFLSKELDFDGLDTYEPSTLVELLPRYLDFLAESGLVDRSQIQRSRDELDEVRRQFCEAVWRPDEDPALIAGIEQTLSDANVSRGV